MELVPQTPPTPQSQPLPPTPPLFSRILERALRATVAESGAVLLLDEDTGDLRVESSALRGSPLAEPVARVELARGTRRGCSMRTLETARPTVTGDVSDTDCSPLFRSTKSHASVPIAFRGRAIGVLTVESSRANAFDPRQTEALAALARDAAASIRRLQLQRASAPGGGRVPGAMVGGLSLAWTEAERRIELASETSATVLLRGESGTGKELAAHSIHFMSPRATRAFVVVNCGAIPEGLLESELFGHVRGSFTGAVADRVGRFEEASGGTLFLDEVGELTPALQVKLLRALESGEITKVGASGNSTRVDVRVVAATNQPLEQMTKDGRFREDLYYRLNVVSIRLPPLREYRDSIPALARTWVREFARDYGRPVRELLPETISALTAYDFPGNLRELRNVIEQAVVLETTTELQLSSLPEAIVSGRTEENDGARPLREAAALFEKKYLFDVLARSGGDVRRAAAIAGVHRVQLYRMVRRHGLDLARFRSAAAPRLPTRLASATPEREQSRTVPQLPSAEA